MRGYKIKMMRTLTKTVSATALAAAVAVAFIVASPVADSNAQSGGGIEPPAIVHPKDMHEIRGEYQVTVIWEKVEGASSYHLVVAKDRKFKEIVYEVTGITVASHKVDNLDFGTYFIKMRSASGTGAVGEFGDWTGFIVVPPSPERLRANP